MLITTEYRNQLKEKYKTGYSPATPIIYLPIINSLINDYKLKSVFDYGCGNQMLKDYIKGFGIDYHPYDPALDLLDSVPVDLMLSIHVMEHVEPDCLEDVLYHMQVMTLKYGLHVIHTTPAKTELPDGRNSHLIQKSPEWWDRTFSRYFKVVKQWNITKETILLVKNEFQN